MQYNIYTRARKKCYTTFSMKRKKMWIGAGMLLLVIFVIFGVVRGRGPAVPTYSSTRVVRQDLVQTVSETGSVKAGLELTYGWEIPGRVAVINKKVGDTVAAGDSIAELESTEQRAALAEAQSRLAAARASLSLKQVGPSAEEKARAAAEVAQAQAAVREAEVQLATVRTSGDNAVRSAEIALDKARAAVENQGDVEAQELRAAYEDALKESETQVQTALDAMITMANIQQLYTSLSGSGQDALTVADKKAIAVESLVGARNAGKWPADAILNQNGGVRGALAAELTANPLSEQGIDRLLVNVQTMLGYMRNALDQMRIALSADSTATATDKTSLTTARSDIDSAMTAVVNAQQAIATARVNNKSNTDANRYAYEQALQDHAHAAQKAEQDVGTALAQLSIKQAALAQAEAAYAVLTAPPREVDIGALRADVAREAANVERAQHVLDKTHLRALAAGVLSALDVEMGETVIANQEVLTILSSELKIDVDVSESDIAKVTVGDMADMTFDAFGDDVIFSGRVAKVEPAETEVSGVIYYKTEIFFEQKEGYDVRPGMTANIDIRTAEKANVLLIPERAILDRNGEKIVRVLTDSTTAAFEERPVETGLKGDDGLIEITRGLNEGEEIITFLKETE